MAQPMETFICVDFGMTGSVTHWRNNRSNPSWSFGREKVPTKLAYDSNGALLAWGQCDDIPYDNVKECFKSYIAEFAFPEFPGAPTSKQVLFRWVQDYLTALCKQTAIDIDAQNDSWRNGHITWNFTVPGSWSAHTMVADFRRLAEDAVFSCFVTRNLIQVHTHLTEGEASALCLLNLGTVARDHRFAVGDIVISCDIGGATTDIAISIVSGAGKLSPCPQLQDHPVGLMSVDKNFWELARQTLRNAGFGEQAGGLAWEMTAQTGFLLTRAAFPRTEDVDRVKIKLPARCSIDDWPIKQSQRYANMATVKNKHLSIPRDMFESLFEDLVQKIEAGIDEAINTLSKIDRAPTVIGFCGGGSKTVYLLDRLRRRYRDTPTIIDHNQLPFSPQLATVKGSCLACDKTQLQEFVQNIRFSIMTKEGLKVRTAEENKETPSFYMTPAWVVTFACSSHSSKTKKHSIFAVPANVADVGSKTNDLAGKKLFAVTKQWDAQAQVPILKKWVVEVDLRNERGGVLSWNRKYDILIKIIGVWEIVVEVRSQQDGEVIPCKVVQAESSSGMDNH
ncbi:hypothetical protein BKA65DRAFT_544273 [Rhexocercosporidium sp. MPI-PUGE-AT-0058]|nr:hypothetical protein BKA65DRAFT_544273 [Rhexocercosporidium sp. MPI-PUGE-AT-0058]